MQRFNYQFAFNTVGLLLIIEAVFMLFSAFVGEYFNETAVRSIYLSALISFFSGALLSFHGRRRRRTTGNITKREVYFTVTSSWLMMAPLNR